MNLKKRCLVAVFTFLVSFSVFAQAPANFPAAKKRAELIFNAHPYTLYCGCQYNAHEINLASCQMQAAELIGRAHRMEFEHMLRRFDNML